MSLRCLEARWIVSETMPDLAAPNLFYLMWSAYMRRIGAADAFMGAA